MNRQQAQQRSANIRSIRGSYALLRNVYGYGSAHWMPGNKRDTLCRIIDELEDLVGWLDDIRSERAKIRAGVVCGKCKKEFDEECLAPRDGYCQCQ